MEQTILRIGSDEHHEAREKFNQGLLEFVERLKTDPEMIEKGEALKNELLEHPSFKGLGSKLHSQMGDSESNLHQRLQTAVQSFGQKVLEEPELQEQINIWLNEATLYMVTHYRDEISQIITDTVKAWDPEVTSQRVELQVGRDLQFIRINGTLVGGFVGLLIYIFSHHVMV